MIRKLIFILALLPSLAFGLTAEERLSDPAKEEQAHRIFRQIRCVVCSGESVNDSKADIARDMRVLIRKKVAQGMDEAQILEQISSSYGDVILMKPPFSPSTYLLWIGPAILFIVGFVIIICFFRKKN